MGLFQVYDRADIGFEIGGDYLLGYWGERGIIVNGPLVELGDDRFSMRSTVGANAFIDVVLTTAERSGDKAYVTSFTYRQDGATVMTAEGFRADIGLFDSQGIAMLFRGDDSILGNRHDDTMRAFGGDDRLYGKGGDDQLFGHNGNDTLRGGLAEDTLSGGTGDDLLGGFTGIDRLDGGRGNDLLTGGKFADVFVFRARDGFDRITDFNPDADRIEIMTGADSFDDLRIRDTGRDATVSFADARITLAGVDAAQIDATDFIFA